MSVREELDQVRRQMAELKKLIDTHKSNSDNGNFDPTLGKMLIQMRRLETARRRLEKEHLAQIAGD